MASMFEILIVDARQTAARMRSDARHLRELGKRALVGARMAERQMRQKFDAGLEKVVDAILDFEERYGGRE